MAGRFLTFEGGEGVGKTTQLRLLAEALAARGQDVLCTREPGGAPGAEALRRLLLEGRHDWSPLAETLLHFAARAEHVARTLRPALLAGRWVLCDRFTDSTLAYQGYGQGADRASITTLAGLVGLAPALTVVLDAPEATAQARLTARGDPADRYERLGQGFHARVAMGFRAIAVDDPGRCVLIEAGGSVQDVHRAVLQAVFARWPEAAGPALSGAGPAELGEGSSQAVSGQAGPIRAGAAGSGPGGCPPDRAISGAAARDEPPPQRTP